MDFHKRRKAMRKFGTFGSGLLLLFIVLQKDRRFRFRFTLALLVLSVIALCGGRDRRSHLERARFQDAHNLLSTNQRPEYSVVDIGLSPGGKETIAFAVNNKSQVIVIAGNDRDSATSYLWENGKWIDLGSLGGNGTVAYGLNDKGQVVGRSTNSQNEERPFLWQDGKIQDLPTLGGSGEDRGLSNEARSINANSIAAGGAYTTKLISHFCSWSQSGVIDHGSQFDGAASIAFGINKPGDIVGYCSTKGGGTKPFLFSNGRAMMLPFGEFGGHAWAINDDSDVVGDGYTSSYLKHGFLFRSGQTIDIGTLGGGNTTAWAINNSSKVVGSSQLKSGIDAAYEWQNGKMRNLNDLIPNGSGWMLCGAWGINESGQIVGNGIKNGKHHAFLLTPYWR